MASLQPPSSVCQNHSADCEDAINTLINLELCTSYTYLSMSYYFDKDEVALKPFSSYFRQLSHGMLAQAEKLMQLQNQRGAQLCFHDVQKPHKDDWEDGLNAMEFALSLYKTVNDGLLDLHRLATDLHDDHLCGYLENHFLPQQVNTINQLADHISNLRNMGAPEKYLF